MKKLILIAAAAYALQACSDDAGKSSVVGSIAGAEEQKVYIEYLGLDQQDICDSALVAKDGSFSLKGKVQSEPTFYNVRLADGRYFTVLLDSAEQLQLKADASQQNFAASVSYTESPRNEALQKVTTGASAILSGIKSSRNVDSLRVAIADYKEELRSLVFQDPQSMVGYYIVIQTVMGSRVFDVMNKQDHQLFSTVATSLKIAYPNSTQVKYLCDHVLAARAQKRIAAKRDSLLQSAEQLNSPDLQLPDVNGNDVRLTSLRGKHVLLHFWSAADENSRKANQQLAKLYKKYKNRGFEIYAVSFDNSKVLWESALLADKAEWINVCDFLGANSIAAVSYNVQQIPANYILDPEGRLIGKDLFGPRLDERLAEIFK